MTVPKRPQQSEEFAGAQAQRSILNPEVIGLGVIGSTCRLRE
jgi:hypothetical protein